MNLATQGSKRKFFSTGLADKRVFLLFILILVLASGLRFYKIGVDSLWSDELGIVDQIRYASLSEVIQKGVVPDLHPPGWRIIIFPVTRLFGDSETALRLPSAILGVFSVALIFFLGAYLYSRAEGLIASLLTAILWMPIYYSRDANSYSALLFFSLLSAYLGIVLVRTLRNEPGVPYALCAGYVMSAVITSYMHYFGLYFVGLQILASLILFWKKPRTLILVAVISALLIAAYLPWLRALLRDWGRPAMLHIVKPQIDFVIRYFYFLFNRSFLLVILMGLVGGAASYKWLSQKRGVLSDAGVFLALWALVPLIAAYFISVTLKPVLTPRNLVICAPAVYLIFARSITTLFQSRKLQAVAALSLALIFFSHLIFGMNFYFKPQRSQIREVSQLIMQNESLYPDPLIVTTKWSKKKFNHYFTKVGSSQRVGMDWTDLFRDKKTIGENHQYVWLVSFGPQKSEEGKDDYCLNYLKGYYRLVLNREFFEARAWLFQKKPEFA